MKIGDIDIQPVIDGEARVPPTMAFTGTTDEQCEDDRAGNKARERIGNPDSRGICWR